MVQHQNLDKQEISKLVVPRLVTDLRVYFDENGRYYLDNVDVGGVALSAGADPQFVAAILNGPVANFVFRRISKPFRGEYRSANKQFIAPLPIPVCTQQLVGDISPLAHKVQSLLSDRESLITDIERRLTAVKVVVRPENWVLPDIGDLDHWLGQASKELTAQERTSWAKSERQLAIGSRYDEIQLALHASAQLASELTNGELRFHIDQDTPIDRVFVAAQEGAFIHAQWDFIARTFTLTENTKSKQLVDALRKLAPATNPALVKQVLELHRQLVDTDRQLADAESSLNQLIYRAYELTPHEVALVEKG